MFRMRKHGMRLALSGMALLLVGATARAQQETLAEDKPRGAIGVHLAAASPLGSSASHLKTRPGIGGFGALFLNSAGTIGLRVDGSLFFLGDNTFGESQTLLGASTPITYEVRTFARMVHVTIGPQLSVRLGPVISYLAIGGGPMHVSTVEEIKLRPRGEEAKETVDANDLAAKTGTGWQAGGGLHFRVGRGAFVGLSVHYVDAGQFRYVPPSSVQSDGDGNVTFDVVETGMRYIVVQISLSSW